MTSNAPSKEDLTRWLENRQEEVDGAFLYRAMAEGESQPAVADIYRRLGAIEEKHATFWEERLRGASHPLGPRRILQLQNQPNS